MCFIENSLVIVHNFFFHISKFFILDYFKVKENKGNFFNTHIILRFLFKKVFFVNFCYWNKHNVASKLHTSFKSITPLLVIKIFVN